ncbi:CesT family type III secretion system chaperone [Pseudomonas sp. GL-B-16]|uniref:CesT family type III secretion system chaperone n=1 Tax=Pseudomonas sp. GL-B-16 TaxID=2832373 RepID=UPI001CBDD210|nr:CesT family type III secretion system chaperone [Pseudomonas sp. GL-B-16]
MEIFEKIVTPLFKSLKIEASKIQDGQFFIELAEGLKVNVICNWEGSVILVANLGGVKDSSQELLWNLLEKNLFCELPQIQISAAAEDKKIIIWTQERLSQLNSSSLNTLFERFVRRAKEVSLIMTNQGQAQPKAASGPPLLTRSRLGTYPDWLPQAFRAKTQT